MSRIKNIMAAVCVLLVLTLLPLPVVAKDIKIVVDPGHGGEQSGATNDEHGVAEKTLDLKIGMFLKEALQQYEGITVVMTRESDREMTLEARAQVAVNEGADFFISLHNNAYGEIADYRNGATVLVPRGKYKPELADACKALGVCVMHELAELGIENQGLMQRLSQANDTYPNGAVADYYGLVRRGVMNDIPSVIIEHSFIDHASDYEKYLADDTKLKMLAEADARGIARFFQLRDRSTGEVWMPPANEDIQILTVVTGYAADNTFEQARFFIEEEPAEEVMESAEEPSESIESEEESKTEKDIEMTTDNSVVRETESESAIEESAEPREDEEASTASIESMGDSGYSSGLFWFVICGILLLCVIVVIWQLIRLML